jgi:hypothetical protein
MTIIEEIEYKPRVGYAYVPPQALGEIYSIQKALEEGTLFPELNISTSQYVPRRGGGGK